MLYPLYEAGHRMLAPMRVAAEAPKLACENPFNPFAYAPQSRTMAKTVRAKAARLISGARFLMLARHLAPGALTLLNDADLASRRLAPPHPHHVLVAVGVTEPARGLGVGRLLVDHTLQRARQDSRSWGVRLETENPGNAELYARWGFIPLGVEPVAQCEVHVMAQAGTPDGENDEVR